MSQDHTWVHRTHRDEPAALAHPWMPWSPCDPSCLVAGTPNGWGGEPRVAAVRFLLRIVALGGAMLVGIVVAAAFPALGSRSQRLASRGWFRLLLAALGIRVRTYGPQVPPGVLMVTNHVSWLDIVALNYLRPARMVAKREVGDWFLIGWMATSGGTVYLDRERLRDLPAVVAQMADRLRGGGTVAVFPEGTTWCGRGSGRYRSAAFQAAIDADALVVPVALRFLLPGARPTSTPSDIGAESTWVSVRRTARLRGLVVRAEVLPALSPREFPDRRALALAAERAVAAACGLPGPPVSPAPAATRRSAPAA